MEFSYIPSGVDNEDGTKTWKLYLKPTALGYHTYVIKIGEFSKSVKIKAAKTIFSR